MSQEMIAAVRADVKVGRGTCSVIDECYTDAELAEAFLNEGIDRKSTRLNSSHIPLSRMPSSA